MATVRRPRLAELETLEGGGAGGMGGGSGRSNSTTLMPRLNKPEIEGYTYRSPSQTNARSLLPHPRENVVESQRADIDRIRRGLSASGTTERGRLAQQEAAGRAITRTGGRAGAIAAAGIAGKAAMDDDEPTEKPSKDKNKDKNKDKDEDEDNFQETKRIMREVDADIKASKSDKMKSGGVVSASKRADGIAQRGKTRGKIY
jgi:hypothetical protein